MVVLLSFSVVLCAAAIAAFFYFAVKFIKNKELNTFNKRIIQEFIGCLGAFTILSILTAFSIKLFNNFPMTGGHTALLFFGSLIFGISFMSLIEAFTIYFYKPTLDSKYRKIIKIIMICSIPLVLISLIMCLESYAPYITFPLTSGFIFSNEGIVFIKPGDYVSGFAIKWYGLIILTGAIVAYFVCDHHFYQEFKRHGIIDTLFILVFLIGILGARFWAVYILPSESGVEFWEFQTGGLGIMGGVLFGAIAGILFLAFFRRYINLRHAADLILPCVLIAQAIGRWGNFFNQEVYGAAIDVSVLSWIPSFIRGNMEIYGSYRIPLFLIESIFNFAGYFVIVYGFGKGLKKHLSFGDLFCLYLVWYGVTRIIMEPLRDSMFENLESIITAWMMFGGGILGIIGLHVYDYLRWGKKTFVIDDNSLKNSPKNPYIEKSKENHEIA